MRDSFVNSLERLAREDSSVILLTADLGFGIFEKFESLFPEQYINVGVAEQNMTGIATGLALEGKTVFTYSIGNFSTLRCLEQIRNDACYHNVNINIVCSGGGFTYGALGMSHHTTEDLSVMRSLPGVTVVAPCNKWEAECATINLAKTPGVGYLRIEKNTGGEYDEEHSFQIGKAIQVKRAKKNNDVSFLVTGGIMKEVREAVVQLESHDISSSIISIHTLKPLDTDMIITCVKQSKLIVTVEENNVLGGLGGAVAEYCLESGNLPLLFLRIGMKDMYSSIVGDQQYLRKHYNMDSKSITNRVLKKLKEI